MASPETYLRELKESLSRLAEKKEREAQCLRDAAEVAAEIRRDLESGKSGQEVHCKAYRMAVLMAEGDALGDSRDS